MEDAKIDPLDDVTEPGEESDDPEYLAWRDEKVRRVLAQKAISDADYLPLAVVLERFRRNAR